MDSAVNEVILDEFYWGYQARILLAVMPAGFTFYKPNLKFGLVFSNYAISLET